MKLDRNLPANNGRGKYALVKLRKVVAQDQSVQPAILDALKVLYAAGVLDYGNTGDADFFVIRLRDKHAAPALAAYAMAAYRDDPEYALEVLNLSKRAAEQPGVQPT